MTTSVTLTSNAIIFGDGSSLSSGVINYNQLQNSPTNLSQFVNDLGNYGNWLTPVNINTTITNQYWNPNMGLQVTTGAGWQATQVQLVVNNCNCVCHCNC